MSHGLLAGQDRGICAWWQAATMHEPTKQILTRLCHWLNPTHLWLFLLDNKIWTILTSPNVQLPTSQWIWLCCCQPHPKPRRWWPSPKESQPAPFIVLLPTDRMSNGECWVRTVGAKCWQEAISIWRCTPWYNGFDVLSSKVRTLAKYTQVGSFFFTTWPPSVLCQKQKQPQNIPRWQVIATRASGHFWGALGE